MAIIRKAQTKTQTAINSTVYSDFFTNLDIHPNKLDVVLHINEDAVSRSIKNIILTNRGEKFFNPIFGSDINSILFENFSPQSESLLKEYIQLAIQNFEPRANIIDIIVSALVDENAYVVTIVFSVINKVEPIKLELLLNRVR